MSLGREKESHPDTHPVPVLWLKEGLRRERPSGDQAIVRDVVISRVQARRTTSTAAGSLIIRRLSPTRSVQHQKY